MNESEANAGENDRVDRDASDISVFKMPKHNCCAYKCSNSEQKKRQTGKYPELAQVNFFPFPPDNPNKGYAPGMTERERRKKWIAACRLQSLNVTRHTRICSVHFEGGLGPTKANPVPTIFDFPQHLQPKSPKCRSDPEERRKNATPPSMGQAKKTKNFKYASTQENPNEPESFDRRYNRGDDHSVAEGVTTYGPMYVDAEVQTVLTASDIQSMEDSTAKLANRTNLKRDIFIEDVCKNDRSVRFYTGIPSLACLFMLFNFLKPMAAKMKYWDGKKKSQKESYQVICARLILILITTKECIDVRPYTPFSSYVFSKCVC